MAEIEEIEEKEAIEPEKSVIESYIAQLKQQNRKNGNQNKLIVRVSEDFAEKEEMEFPGPYDQDQEPYVVYTPDGGIPASSTPGSDDSF